MLVGYYCPDNAIISVDQCINGVCRKGERCLSLPTLLEISQERVWAGVPSTTQLLNGTMHEFLKLTKPHIINPRKQSFRLHGTRLHKVMENSARKLSLPSEIPLSIDRDVFDLLQPVEDGTWMLVDYKTWGSYRVAKALGIISVGRVPDHSGAVYKSSGKWGKAGSPKMVDLYQEVPDKADNLECELQLNRYRLMLRKLDIPVSSMRMEIWVRDGDTQIARGRGVTEQMYYRKVKMLDDAAVETYFEIKRTGLLNALEQDSWDQPCTDFECWDKVRCKSRDFCPVNEWCTQGQLLMEDSSGTTD